MSLLARSLSRGVTIVEVMMALSMVAIGASGVIAMGKVTIVANRDAKNLEVANEIARTWMERLRADSVLWNHPSPMNATPDLETDTVWLRTNVTNQWVRPVNADAKIYGVHDALGRDDPTNGVTNGPYCVNLRLSWLRTDRSIRAEVRVYWLRQNITGFNTTQVPASPLCGSDPRNPPLVQFNTEIYHFVHVVSEIRQNTAM